VLVADTGDIEAIRKYKPTDATTNPSLIYKAAQMPQYQSLVDDAVAYAMAFPAKERLEEAMDRLAVNFGCEIAKIVPGVVSTEVDARLSFKPKRSIDKARKLIKMYAEKGIPKEKILIKLAATWQGICAAKQLETEGISCNLTLLFSHEAQAVACAEANVTLISPFVGRITDWYKKNTGTKDYAPEQDPGVLSVRQIYQYYKKYGYKTIIMGASFRSKAQCIALAGCDKLTIGPKFLQQMQQCNDPVEAKLFLPPASQVVPNQRPARLDDRHFYMRMCQDPMAVDKLHEGIRNFVKDQIKLEDFVKARMAKL
jgi:transaldolase